MAKRYKFEDCRHCANRNDPDTCDECDMGELFEDEDEGGLDFDDVRDAA